VRVSGSRGALDDDCHIYFAILAIIIIMLVQIIASEKW
jgi:hypothetical protein